jgi:opacity protein-like surface antigen
VKKLSLVSMFLLFGLLLTSLASADTYSKFSIGAGFSDLEVCAFGTCLDDGTTPKIDTDTAFHFKVVPIAVRQPLQGDVGVRLESELSVSRRDFTVEGVGPYEIEGDDTRYSFGGNLLFDVEMGRFSPYVGGGVGFEYSKLAATINAGPGLQASTHDDFGRYWKLIGGVDIPIMGNVKGNLEYNWRHADRYRDTGFSQLNWDDNGEHIISAGLGVYW